MYKYRGHTVNLSAVIKWAGTALPTKLHQDLAAYWLEVGPEKYRQLARKQESRDVLVVMAKFVLQLVPLRKDQMPKSANTAEITS